MKKVALILIIAIYVISVAYSQSITEVLNRSDLNFYQKVKLIEDNNREVFTRSEQYEQKRYGRWFKYWYSRVDNTGSFTTYPQIVIDYLKGNFKNQNKSSGGFTPQFNLIGPFENQMYGNSSGYSTAKLKNYIGQVKCVLAHPTDPNIVYAGAPQGGIFKTTNALASDPQSVQWSNITDNYFGTGVFDLVFAPDNPEIIYAATGIHVCGIISESPSLGGGDYGLGIFKSSDAGATWEQVFNVAPEERILLSGIAVDKNNSNIIYSVSYLTVYKSTDYGHNWVNMQVPTQPSDALKNIVIDYSNNRIYAGGHGKLFYFDGIWNEVSSNLPATGHYRLAYNPVDPDGKYIYALFQNGNLYKTNDGIGWTLVKYVGGTANYCVTLTISDNGKIYAGGVTMYYSGDNGISFQQFQASPNNLIHADCRDVGFSNSTNNPTFIVTDGGVLRNTTGLHNNWVGISGNLSLSQFYELTYYRDNPDVLLGGTADCGTLKRFEDGTWGHMRGGDGASAIIDWTNPNTMYCVPNFNISRSWNSNTTFGYANETNPNFFNFYDQEIIQDPSDPSIIYAAHWSLIKATNQAPTLIPGTSNYDYKLSWTSYPNQPGGCSLVTSFAVSQGDDKSVAIARSLPWSNPDNPSDCTNPTYTSLYITHDGGTSWIDADNYFETNYGSDFFNFNHITDIEFDPNNPNRIWVVFAGFTDGKHVFFSQDGGNIWSNISFDIPNIPTNCIAYDYVNKGVFLGTDFGIYYLPEGSNNWEKLDYNSTGMPDVIVNDLRISYEFGKLIVGTFGRSAWSANLYNSCEANSSSLSIDATFPSTTTWNVNKTFNKSVTIKQGHTLKIKSTIKFQDDCKIIIEPGGKLILDGGKLISNNVCGNNMWQGIEIQGNSSFTQTDANQGVFEMKNGAVIENATIGVLLGHWKIDQYHPAYGGGILRAEPGCIFRNNTTAIKFTEYAQPNTSYIYGCQFITDADYLGTAPSSFISLTNVTGINIQGNTFKNENYTAFAYNQRGKGITSTGSKFTVDDYAISGTSYQSKFENLWYGIYATNYISVNTFEIKNTDFKNNYIGVKLSAINYAKIQNNNIEVNTQAPSNDNSCGVYLQSSSGYGVQNNNFTTTNNGHYGVYVNNTGTTANTIFQNNFNSLQTNIQADSQNKGLVMRCNNFVSTTTADIAITGSVNIKQGNCFSSSSAANNLFNRNGSSTDIWSNPGTSMFNYTYNPSNRTTPVTYDPSKVVLLSCGTAYNPDMCMIRLRQTSELLATINSTPSTLSQLKTQIDGGNTQNLLSIAMSDQPAGQIKNKLLEASPYLSDEVLIASINRTGKTPLPDGILKEIIVPNSPVTTDVMKALINRNPHISTGIFTEINNAQTGISPRAELENEIASVSEENGIAINELLQIYLLDTNIVNGVDSLIAFLQTQNNTEAIQQLIQSFIYTGQCTQAKSLLTQMQPATEDESYFVTFFNILADVCISGDSIQNLTGQQLQTITNIANSSTIVSANAQSLLSLLTDEYYPEIFTPLIAPDTSKIVGYLYESANCGGSTVADDTLQIIDESNNVINTTKQIITDNNGKFEINQDILYLLDTLQLYSFTTKSGYKIGSMSGIEMPQFKTIAEWKNESPLTFTLSNSNLEWSDLWSSPDSLVNIGTAIDLGGHVYVAGRTSRNSNLNDVVLMKFTPQGERLWLVTYNTGKANDNTTDDLAIDKDGNSYLSVSSSMSNVVLLKYNTDGILQWQQTITNATTSQKSRANAIAIDSRGNICITGYIENTSNSTADIFVASYQPNGTRNWLKTYHKADFDMALDIICDKQNNVYITGMVNNYTTHNVNLITLKYNKSGALQWEKEVDLGTVDTGNKILIDNVGNIIVGATANDKATILKYSPSGIPQWQSVYGTNSWIADLATDNENNILASIGDMSNYITVKYNTNGVKIWETKYNDNYDGFDYPGAIITDAENNVYVTGRSATVSKSSRTQISEIVTIKYDKDGNQIWLNRFNNNQQSSTGSGNDMVISENGNIYITGYSSIITSIHHSYLTTLKYSQCPATANLKSTMFTPQVTANNETVEDIDDDELIQVINFKENKVIVYPNPYTESTRIELITKTDAQVSLEVYTMGGKLIENIFTGFSKEGKYNYTFSAKSKGYSAGTYLLKIMVNNEVNSYWLVEMK